MPRLIDADWLIELYDGLDEYMVKVAVVKANIEDAPTIDADEIYAQGYTDAEAKFRERIVYCRECKWWRDDGCGDAFCRLIGVRFSRNRDDFCSYGERRK